MKKEVAGFDNCVSNKDNVVGRPTSLSPVERMSIFC